MNDLFSIKGKVVLVTGAGSGIGKIIADEFAMSGAIVFYGNHRLNSKTKYESLKYQLDIEDSSSRTKLVKEIKNRFENIDVLVNAVGITRPGYSQFDWNHTLETNLTAIYDMCMYVANTLMMIKGGSIINITSINSDVAGENNPSYNVSKAGLKMLSKSLAKDLAIYGIRVNNLCPGYVQTKMTKRTYDNLKTRMKREERTMLKRFAKPEEMVGPAIFLASNASSYITGSDLVVDGGYLSNGI